MPDLVSPDVELRLCAIRMLSYLPSSSVKAWKLVILFRSDLATGSPGWLRAAYYAVLEPEVECTSCGVLCEMLPRCRSRMCVQRLQWRCCQCLFPQWSTVFGKWLTACVSILAALTSSVLSVHVVILVVSVFLYV